MVSSIYLLGFLISNAPNSFAFEHPGGLNSKIVIERVAAEFAKNSAATNSLRNRLAMEIEKNGLGGPHAIEEFSVPAFYQDPDGHRKAKALLGQDGYSAYLNAAASALLPVPERTRYASHARKILNAWASINQKIKGEDTPLVLAYLGTSLILSAELLSGDSEWDLTNRSIFRNWVRQTFIPSVSLIVDRKNNWGDWGTYAFLAASYYLDDQSGFELNIRRLRSRILTHIETDGHIPQETARKGKGIWYTYFALAPITGSAQILKNALSIVSFFRKCVT